MKYRLRLNARLTEGLRMLMRSCSPSSSLRLGGGVFWFGCEFAGWGVKRLPPPGNLETLPDAKNCTAGNSRLSFVYGGLV